MKRFKARNAVKEVFIYDLLAGSIAGCIYFLLSSILSAEFSPFNSFYLRCFNQST